MDAEKSFKRFDEINHLPLRTYNRVALLFNLVEDFHEGVGEQYLALFTDGEKKQMYLMSAYIKSVGKEAAQKAVTRDLTVVGDDDEAVDE